MKLALIGLGKMGSNMARRLANKGHQVVGYNRTPEIMTLLTQEIGMIQAASLADAVARMEPPRIVWAMVPAGPITGEVLLEAGNLLAPGDILIDGGNSHFTDTIERAKALNAKGIHFLDVGVSGGIWGLTEGYSMMIGGNQTVVNSIRPVFEALAPGVDEGWGWVGPNGSGHYVKMVHNAIEYGMMEAYAEGFELLDAGKEFQIDTRRVAEIWRYGSVVRSWLLDLIIAALAEDPELEHIKGWVEDSGEGRWTVINAIDHGVPVPAIAFALFRRFYSRQEDGYSAKLLAALRNQFGGHAVFKIKPEG